MGAAEVDQANAVSPGWLGAYPVKCVIVESRRENRFEKAARLAHLLGRGQIEWPVQPDDPAKRAQRIAFIRADERRGDIGRGRGAAGIIVLENAGRRLRELTHEPQCAIEIEQIVER